MDRLTKRIDGKAAFVHGSCFDPQQICDHLAAYEDTGLEPEEFAELGAKEKILHNQEKSLEALTRGCSLPRLQELAEADKDGRCVVLPVPVGRGKTVYGITDPDDGYPEPIVPIACDRLDGLEIWPNQSSEVVVEVGGWEIGDSNIGKTVFLTRAEAEATLKGAETDG